MGDMGLGILKALGKLTIALYLACFVHIIMVYGGLIVKTILKLPLARFFYGVLARKAWLTRLPLQARPYRFRFPARKIIWA